MLAWDDHICNVLSKNVFVNAQHIHSRNKRHMQGSNKNEDSDARKKTTV